MRLDGSNFKMPLGFDEYKEITLPRIEILRLVEDGWQPSGEFLSFDKTLFVNLYQAAAHAKKYNGDLLYVIDGEEGSGKSTLARQVAMVLDKTFSHERIAYSTDDFIEMFFVNGKFTSVVLDEAKADVDRKRSMSKKNVNFMNFLSVARDPHHKFAGVVLPSIYDLDSYVAEHRASFLLHCYLDKGKTPGAFRFYSKKRIKQLFYKGKKYRTYPVKPNFVGRFSKQEVVDLDKYHEMKSLASARFRPGQDGSVGSSSDEIIRDFIKSRIKQYNESEIADSITKKDLAELLGIGRTTLYLYEQELLEE